MCLDIDPDSVIHELLVKKITYLIYYGDTQLSNNLTMLPSFHISLGKPPSYEDLMVTDDKTEVHKELSHWINSNTKEIPHIKVVPIIGDITLAPIVISEKDNKKSAWIPLHPHWLDEILLTNELNLDNFDSFDHRCDECPVQHLHVSVANLTGEPRDSIARPEDCIIDTINN